MERNIYPVFDKLIQRTDREERLQQRAKVLWFTGLSGSGKSTIAEHLERKLFNEGYFPIVLDGDNVRAGLNNNLSFSESDRIENIRRIAEVAKLFIQSGIIVITAFISPTRAMREMAREIVGGEDFLEIYINTPLEVCEQRDIKGLYAKARKGEIKNFTGIQAIYEVPLHPALEVFTISNDIELSVNSVYNFILTKISI